MAPYEIEDRGNEHPVAIFVLVASVLFAMIFLLAQATSGSGKPEQGGSNAPVEAITPSGGGGDGSTQVLDAGPSPEAAPVAVLEAPASPVAPALLPTAPAPVAFDVAKTEKAVLKAVKGTGFVKGL